MQIGKLRHRVKLQHVSATQDNYGESVRQWSTYKTVWARVEPLSGRELEHAQQISAETSHRVTIRHHNNVAVEDRIEHDDTVLEVTAIINPDRRNEKMILMCKEVT